MTREEKDQIRELAAQLRDASAMLNWIIKNTGDKTDIIAQGTIVESIGQQIRVAGRR